MRSEISGARIRLLRAQGLVAKFPRSWRYRVTERGQRFMSTATRRHLRLRSSTICARTVATAPPLRPFHRSLPSRICATSANVDEVSLNRIEKDVWATCIYLSTERTQLHIEQPAGVVSAAALARPAIPPHRRTPTAPPSGHSNGSRFPGPCARVP
jgi:hypothetical protein